MKLQGRNLSVNVQGEDVKLLQEHLKRLGLAIDDREGVFGNATHTAVQDFQRKHGLDATGVVDDRTAQLLTEVLKALGLGLSGSNGSYVVTGQVRSAEARPVPGMTVRAFDKDMRGEPQLIEVTPGHALPRRSGRGR